jgi:hypothetical protein
MPPDDELAPLDPQPATRRPGRASPDAPTVAHAELEAFVAYRAPRAHRLRWSRVFAARGEEVHGGVGGLTAERVGLPIRLVGWDVAP